MRITGGTHRGRILKSPDDQTIRPTADKTRLAIFNILESRGGVVDQVVMDLCCGTGAFALDALSRGATHAILIDQERLALELARENARLFKLDQHCTFMQADGAKLPPRGVRPFANVVFLDPPYNGNLVPPMIAALIREDWLADSAVIVAETEKKAPALEPDGFDILQVKTYGETRVTVLRRR